MSNLSYLFRSVCLDGLGTSVRSDLWVRERGHSLTLPLAFAPAFADSREAAHCARLLAGKAKLRLPRAVSSDDVPVALSNTLRVEGRTGNDLSGDRECRHAYAVRFHVFP
jgi:hypothetical protein